MFSDKVNLPLQSTTGMCQLKQRCAALKVR